MGARASTPSRAPYSRCGAALLVATLGALAQARGQELSLDLPLDVPVDLRLAPATDDYRTPLAGERYETELFGERVVVERRDRSNTTALTLGGGAFAPSVGGTTSVPILALFSRGIYPGRRYRLVASGLVNTFNYAETFGVWELLAELRNDTIPVQRVLLVDGKAPAELKRIWGTAGGGLGAGISLPVQPGGFENAFNVGLTYEGWYEYHQRGEDAPKGIGIVATDTYVHGFRARIRLDALQRNLLELPHSGVACGVDLSWSRRDRWRDYGRDGLVAFDAGKTRDALKLQGYAVVVLPVPGLSTRHRLMGQFHFGWAPTGTLDRYSAFQIFGGPIPSESGDLARPPFPGATFDDFPLMDFAVATVEYRYELSFFAFTHLRASWGLGKVPTLRNSGGSGALRFKRKQDYAFGAGLTTGFLWESLIAFEVGYTVTGNLRSGQEGTSFLLLWSKSF
ncbi:MAG: hypothetical protein KDD82_24570 [Planctomycetes bacterium]|nr:hypothetical protein [Planctomycetota bacterium]